MRVRTGWVEWDRAGRKDGVRSYDLRVPGLDNWYRVHVGAAGGATLVLGGLGVTIGGMHSSAEAAMVAGEEHALAQAQWARAKARRDEEAAFEALAWLEGLAL